jgi:hypothetical protein
MAAHHNDENGSHFIITEGLPPIANAARKRLGAINPNGSTAR